MATRVLDQQRVHAAAGHGEKTGLWSWITTVDHKRIGILYGATAFLFFLMGGIEALLLRIQLGSPDNTFLSPERYNELFTMHGTTMIFLAIMPLSAMFFNFLIPLQIGARDVAFPRLNAFSYWVFLLGGLFLNVSWLFNAAPDQGWFGYANLTSRQYSPGMNVDFWMLGLQILGIASLAAAVNFFVTIVNLRAPGMKLMRMPMFVWMSFITQVLLLLAFPVITVALILLMFDRFFGTHFFVPSGGGDPILWQHLFWIFGHPEVYILILPSFGIVSEVLPVFSRKPLFGYPFVVFSGVAIGFMGWGVWAHHMFASGLGPISVAVFSATTMFIAVPTGVKIINWIATMWGGRLWFTTAMLFAIGLVVEFTIGGLSGVTHAVSPSDTQQTDTYYIVAHFHYVLFGGAVFGLFAGFYYWWPKVFGRMLSETLGKLNFWLMVIGVNLTFGPMHILGLQGNARRTYVYPANQGLEFWNFVETVGAFILAVGIGVFVINAIWSFFKPRNAPLDPWDARAYEWMTTSPPKAHNFDAIPAVHSVDEFFHRKYEEDASGRLVRVATAEEILADQEAHADRHMHMPSPSYWPLVVSFGLPVVGFGLIYNHIISVIGGLIILAGVYGWSQEPSVADSDEDATPPEGGTKELATLG